MTRKVFFSIALMSLAFSGCNSHEPDAPAVAAPAPKAVAAVQRPEASRGIRIPDRLRFPHVQSVHKAQSWDDRLATLTNAEKQRLESLNARYYGMLEFHSPEEQKKLIEAGYPMPEEWLAADAMSDEDLADLAKAMSPKGSMFYADRELDRFIEARQRLIDSGAYNDMDRAVVNPKIEAMISAGNALALTRSPFAAYLYGSINAELFHDPAYTAAAISVAWSLGDERAQEFARLYSMRLHLRHVEPLSLGQLAATESLLWQNVHRYRPL